jgi:hypothetical protein
VEIPSKEFSNLIDINIKGVANIIRHSAMVKKETGVLLLTLVWLGTFNFSLG